MDDLKHAYDLMIMSVIKPDSELRTEAKEAGCYKELMAIRKSMISYLENARSTLKWIPQMVLREAIFNVKNFTPHNYDLVLMLVLSTK